MPPPPALVVVGMSVAPGSVGDETGATDGADGSVGV